MKSVIPLRRLKIAVLECPYDSWDDPATRELFNKMIELKLKGYRSRFPYGILPVDATDLVASHLMVCEERADGLRPILAYRSISTWRCEMHTLKFPALALAEGAASADHIASVKAILASAKTAGQQVRYGSSYTILPELKDDKVLVDNLKKFFTGMHYLIHVETGTSVSMCTGAVKFKTDRFFATWGYEPLRLHDRDLPAIRQATLFDEEARMLQLKQFSQHAKDCAEEIRRDWEARIVVRETRGTGSERAA